MSRKYKLTAGLRGLEPRACARRVRQRGGGGALPVAECAPEPALRGVGEAGCHPADPAMGAIAAAAAAAGGDDDEDAEGRFPCTPVPDGGRIPSRARGARGKISQ